MRRYSNRILISVLIAVISGCSREPESVPESVPESKEPVQKVDSADSFGATVLSSTNAGRYTYIELTPEGAEETKMWVATTKCMAKPGDKVQVFRAYLMKDFYSPTLKRTFEEIYFTGTVLPEGDLPPQGGGFHAIGTNSPHAGPHAGPLPEGHPTLPTDHPALPDGHPVVPEGHPPIPKK